MKRNIIAFLLFAMTCTCFAQTQQGSVKTPTRRGANGRIIQGKYLDNATIEILFVGNNNKQGYRSDTEGKFSFPATTPFYVINAIKGPYTFLDADFSTKVRHYSKDDLEILVDDPKIMAKIREEIIQNERKTLREQIRAKEDEIEELINTNKKTAQECNRMLDELDNYRKNSEQIVRQIAEIFVTTDLDKLDDFNKELFGYVEDGDFFHADSLLRTQDPKDNIFREIKGIESANFQVAEHLTKSKEYEAKRKASFAQALYSEHLMWLQKPMMQDSALYCLKMRADLDTTDMAAIKDYVMLCYQQNKLDECKKYIFISLRFFLNENSLPDISKTMITIGAVYGKLGEYANCEKYTKAALEILKQLSRKHPDLYRQDFIKALDNLSEVYFIHDEFQKSIRLKKFALRNAKQLILDTPDDLEAYDCIAIVQAGLGRVYSCAHDYVNSEKYYKLAIESTKHLFREKPDVYRERLAGIQRDLGTTYSDMGDYTNGEKFLKLALNSYEQLYIKNPDAYCYDVNHIQHNLGTLYQDNCDYSNGVKYLEDALNGIDTLSRRNPHAHRNRAELAKVQTSLGLLYRNIGDYTNSEKYHKLALENFEQLSQESPDIHASELSDVYSEFGALYGCIGAYDKSIKYENLALEILDQLFRKDPNAYRVRLACSQYYLGIAYLESHDHANGEKYLKLALQNYKQLNSQDHDKYHGYISSTLYKLGRLYNECQEFVTSEKYLQSALKNFEQSFRKNPFYRDDLASCQEYLGLFYISQKDYENGEKYLKLALENREFLFTQSQDRHRGKLLLIQFYLGSIYRIRHDYANSEKYFNLSLENSKLLYQQDSSVLNCQNLAYCYWNMHLLYEEMQNAEGYYNCIDNALKLFKITYASGRSEDKEYVILLQCKAAYGYLEKGDIDEASRLAQEVYLIDEHNEAAKYALALCYWNTMLLFEEQGDEVKYDSVLAKALGLYSELYSSRPSAYLDQVVELRNRTIWRMLLKNGDIKELLNYAKETFAMDKSSELSKYALAFCYNSKAYAHANEKQFKEALASIEQAISLVPTSSDFYDSKGEILLMQGKNQEALEMWEKVLELNPDFLKDKPDGTELSKGLKKLGLIK